MIDAGDTRPLPRMQSGRQRQTNIPLRSIVSFVTSPTYQLSRHLSFILSPLVGKTSSAVRNSKDFADFISTQQLEEKVLVSFDVVSLFTNVPTDLAIKVARKYLEKDETLEEHTLLTVDNIILLLDMCLGAIYLQFRQECYQQTQGTAMGSPVSVTVANLVMEDVEQRALSTFRGRCPLFWKRYVDDTCIAIHPEESEEFHGHLNSIEPPIQFTKEIQQDNKLPFLDINLNLMKEDDGTISTSVYQKKTQMDQYLQFSFHHPIAHKQAVIRTLFTRASRQSSSLIHRFLEESHVVTVLQENGYPSRLIQKHHTQGRQRQDNSEKPSARVTLPYIQGMSEAIRRVLGELDTQTAFKPLASLWNILSHPKDPISQESRSSVIYQIPCADCSKSYVGQTGRNLSQRIREHRRYVENFDMDTSALVEHAIKEDHWIAWKDASVSFAVTLSCRVMVQQRSPKDSQPRERAAT